MSSGVMGQLMALYLFTIWNNVRSLIFKSNTLAQNFMKLGHIA